MQFQTFGLRFCSTQTVQILMSKIRCSIWISRFYIFKLDFLKQLNEMLIGAVLLIIVVTVIYYAILMTVHTPNIFEEEAEPINDDERYAGSSNPFEGMGGDNPFGKAFEAFGKKCSVNRNRSGMSMTATSNS